MTHTMGCLVPAHKCHEQFKTELSEKPSQSREPFWAHTMQSVYMTNSISLLNCSALTQVLQADWHGKAGNSPKKRSTGGMAVRAKMVLHCVAGMTMLHTRAPKIPKQMTSWFTLPKVPRKCVGATCTFQTQHLCCEFRPLQIQQYQKEYMMTGCLASEM